MKKIILTLVISFLHIFTTYSQTPEPTPTPVVNDDIVKITTTLIQVDVTVTDKKGKPVKDLKPQEFEILENGKKQKITNVTFVSSVRESETNTNKQPKNEGLDIPAPVKELKPNEVRRTIALVIDDLSLSFESTHYVRKSLRNFVDKQMQPGDLIAIIRTSGGVGALQQFTSDKRLLYAAINKIKWDFRSTGEATAFKSFNIAVGDLDPSGQNRGNSEPSMSRGVPISEEDFDSFRKSTFAVGTLGALQYVVDGMSKLPGRKSIMLMSDGFQMFSRGKSSFFSSPLVYDNLTRLVDAANRAAVLIYTMDARGLQPLGFTAADSLGGPIRLADGGSRKVRPTDLQRLASQRREEFRASQDGIDFLAKETGGLAIRNTNDLRGGIKKMLDDQSYYLISYEPDEKSFDPQKRRFNKLDIKVKRDDVNVRYRSGFFNISDREIKKPTVNLTGNQLLVDALVSPFSINEIDLNLSTIFRGNNQNELFIKSYLHIATKDLKFTKTEEGTQKASFDVIVANFGDNGTPTDEFSKTFTINTKGETYQRILRDGIIYFFDVPIKKSGAYQMRVAIRDHSTNKVGSASRFIQVPKLEKKRLTLSGMVLDNVSYKQWNAITNSSDIKFSTNENQVDNNLSPMSDTALLKFKRGSVLRYALEVYNAKKDTRGNNQILMRSRLFRGNKLVFEGKDKAVDLVKVPNQATQTAQGAINLGTEIQLGDYILQIVITDKLAKKKRQIATQFVQFEVVE